MKFLMQFKRQVLNSNFNAHGRTLKYFEADQLDSFERIDLVHDVISINHTGWYTDDFGDTGTICGVIGILKGRKDGQRLILSGYRYSDSDGYVFDMSYSLFENNQNDYNGDIIDSCDYDNTSIIKTVVHDANSLAEKVAELDRNYNKMCDLESSIDDIKDEIFEAVKSKNELKKLYSFDMEQSTCKELMKVRAKNHTTINSGYSRIKAIKEEIETIKKYGV